MKSKTLSLFTLSILTVLVLISMVSALDISSTTTSIPQSPLTGSITIDVIGDANEVVNFTKTQVMDYNDNEISLDFVPSAQITLDDNGDGTGDGTIDVDYDLTDFDFFGKAYSVTITATDDTNDSITDSLSIPFAQTTFCEWDDGVTEDSDYDHIKLQIKDISVTEGFGEDEEWYPQDEVEIEIEVENKNSDDDIDDVTIEWGIFDKDSGEWVIDVDDEKDFNLKDGDEETIILSFKIDDLDEDFEDLGDLIFYARATGDDDSAGNVCSSDSEDVKIITDDEFVILDNIEFSETASCGSELQITADVWNVGDEEQEDVYVIIYNKELGINKKVEIGDIDDFDNEKLDVTITLPNDVEEKQYDLLFSIYDEDGEIYETDEEEDKSEFFAPVTLDSCSTVLSASVSASLQSDANAGEELVVKAVIINTGSGTKTFDISASNYADWASLGSIDKTSVTLDEGESEEVLVTLNVDEDVSGEKKFNIELVEGTKFVSQPVSVTIAQSSNLPSLTGLFSGIGGDNWYLWGIGALNVLLVLVIIIVAVRVARKKE